MKRIWLCFCLAVILTLSIALPVLAYTYYAMVYLSETSGNTYAMFPARTPNQTVVEIANGWITDAAGLTTRVRTGGSSIPHMLADDKLLFAYPLPANTTQPLRFTTGETALASGAFYNIFGYDSYYTVADTAAGAGLLEPGDNFTMEWTGYHDLSTGTSKYYANKPDAISIANDAAGQITANITVTNVAIAHTANGAYADVNVSGLVPATATGVVLEVMSSTSTPRLFAIRKNGSTDDRYQSVTHCWITIGLDANKIFEVKEVAGGDIQIYLLGYTYGAGITLNTNANDISLVGFGAWTDIDVSAITPAGTLGVIVEVQNVAGAGKAVGLRKNGSADARIDAIAATDHFFAYIGVDAARILEGYASDTNVNFYLVGYITSGATFLTNGIDKSLAGAGVWTNIDLSANVTTGTNFAIFEMIGGGGGAVGLRSNASTEDRYQNLWDLHGWGLVNCDNAYIVEGKINAVTLDFFLVGYFTSGISTVAASVSATGVSSGDKTVTVTGTAPDSQWATGNVLSFDGTATSYIDTGGCYNGIASLWLSLWFKLDSNFGVGSPDYFYIFSKRNPANTYLEIWLDKINGRLYWYYQAAGVSKFQCTSTETSWVAGTWYHVLASMYDTGAQTNARLRVSGGTAVTGTDPTRQVTPNSTTYIGNHLDAALAMSTLGCVGTIQNVVVGTDGLTSAEEVALSTGTAPADATDYWYIDEGTGNTVYSYGTAPNNGTKGAGVTWATSTYTSGSTGRLCDFWITDGTVRFGKNLKGVSVPNNGNIWTFNQNNVMPYMEYYKQTVGGAQVAWYQPVSYIVGTNLPDRAGATQNGTIHWGSNPTGVSVTMGSFIYEPTLGAAVTGVETVGAAPPVNVGGEGWFPAEEEITGIPPLAPTVRDISVLTGDPEYLFWWFLTMLSTVLAMAIMAKYTQHMWLMSGAGIVILSACVAMMMIQPFVIPLITGALLIPLLMERKPSW